MKKILILLILISAGTFGFLFYKEGFKPVEYIAFVNKKEYVKKTIKTVKEPKATLIFGGDVMLSRGIGKIIEREKNPYYHWKNIQEIFSAADIAFINLESVISDKGRDLGNLYSFRGKPKTIKGLNFAGIDVVSIANNHVWDWGESAFVDSIDRLWNAGIAPVGGGKNYREAHREVVLMTDSGIRVAFLSYANLLPQFLLNDNSSPAVADIEIEKIAEDLKRVNDKVDPDFTVATFHWGDEYETSKNKFQEEIAKATIDAGADIIIGHHPHVVQEVEKYKDGVIAYSLGNLIFDQNFSEDTGWGLVLRLTLNKDEIEKIEKIRVNFNSTYVPEIGTIEEL